MKQENPFRTALEDIVLELQTQLQKAKFQLSVADGNRNYADDRLQYYQKNYKILRRIFGYIAVTYGNAVKNETNK